MSKPPLPKVTALLRAGLSSARRTARLLFPVYVVNLLVAVFAVLPVYLALHRVTAYRPAAERLVNTWDLDVLVELFTDHPALFGQLQGTFLFVPVAYLLLSQLLLGGVLGALAEPGKPTARQFGRDALTGFGPLCWVLVWSAVPFALAAAVGALGVLLAKPLGGTSALWGAIPGGLLWLWTDAALDYARVQTVTGSAASSLRRLLRGFGIVLRSPLRAWSVHLVYGLLGWVPVGILLVIPDAWDAGGTGRLFLAFLIRQLLVFTRTSLRVASLGSHLALMQAAEGALEAAARTA